MVTAALLTSARCSAFFPALPRDVCREQTCAGGLHQTLDHEVRTFGIRAALVEPVYTKTKITANERSVQAAIPAYAEQKQRVTEIIEKEIANGDDPRAVAEVVYDAVTAKSPRLHYPVGEGVMLSRLHRFVPSRMFDSVFRKRFQLDEAA